MRNHKPYRAAKAFQAAVIDSRHLHRLPQALLAGTRFINWRWGDDKRGGLTKRPWTPERGTDVSGADLSNAVDAVTAMGQMDENTGLGIMCGPAGDAFPMVIGDIDCKGFTSKDGPVVELDGGAVLPQAVYDLAMEAVGAGAYAELSPSRQGVHLIFAGTLPAAHRITGIKFTEGWADRLTAGMTEEGRKKISTEWYTEKKWLTMTGEHLHGEGESTWEPNAGRSQPWLDRFAEAALKRTGPGGAAAGPVGDALELGELVGGYCEPAEADPRLAAAARVPAFMAVWRDAEGALTGTADFSHSARRWKLLGWLVAALGGDTVAAGRAFARSALMDAKVLTMRGTNTLLEYELARALAAWDGEVFPRALRIEQSETNRVLRQPEWPAEARQSLMFKVLNTAPGTASQKNAMRAILGDLFERLDEGEWYLHDGLCVVKTGGLRGIAERAGGQPTQIMHRLQWLAQAGLIARVTRESDQHAPVISIAMSSNDCLALQEGLRPGLSPMPTRPVRARKAVAPGVKQEAAPRAPRTRKPTPQLNRARWTMFMSHQGVRSAGEIAAETGTSLRAVKAHIQALQTLGLMTLDLAPTVTPAQFAELRREEVRVRQARTITRRGEDAVLHAEWLRRRAEVEGRHAVHMETELSQLAA